VDHDQRRFGVRNGQLAMSARSLTRNVTARPIVPSTPYTLLPARGLIRGINIRSWLQSTNTTKTSCADFWTEWPWATQIVPDIEAAFMLGFNTIRVLISSACRYAQGPPFEYAPQLDTGTFLDRIEQLVKYVQAKGMRIQLTLSGDSAQTATGGVFTEQDPPVSWFEAEFALICRALRGYNGVVYAVDVMNEVVSSWAETVDSGTGFTYRKLLYDACKAAAPNLRFGWSGGPGTIPASGGTYDYVDFHIYETVDADYADAWIASAGCPLMIGETGAITSEPSNRAARYASDLGVAEFIGSAGRRIAGVQLWDLVDGWYIVAGDYGVCDLDTYALRADAVTIVTTLPTSS
jgi:hypothetical protein